jgi:hypothetical protein
VGEKEKKRGWGEESGDNDDDGDEEEMSWQRGANESEN